MSHYSELDPDISLNSCAALVNIIHYSIKICPEIEGRLGMLIKSEIDMNSYRICFPIIKFLNFNLQMIGKSIDSKIKISNEDELCFKNMSRA